MGTTPPEKEIASTPADLPLPTSIRQTPPESPPGTLRPGRRATTPTSMILKTSPFPPVSWYRLLAKTSEPVFIDATEQFRKQTMHNRYQIATATGPQTLTIPVEGSKRGNIRDIRISGHNNWRRLHWQAICTAYGSSPFFEYYADDIAPLFGKNDQQAADDSQCNSTLLFDYNLKTTEVICSLLDLKAPQVITTPVQSESNQQPTTQYQQPYYQVFQSRQGFLPDMSILDLLFNMGPESILVLTKD